MWNLTVKEQNFTKTAIEKRAKKEIALYLATKIHGRFYSCL